MQRLLRLLFGANLAVVVPAAIIRAKMQYEGWKKFPFNLWRGLGAGAVLKGFLLHHRLIGRLGDS